MLNGDVLAGNEFFNKFEGPPTKVAHVETVAATGLIFFVPQVKESAVPLTDVLVGIPTTTIDNSVKGITVSSELERLVNQCGVFDNQSSIILKAYLYDKDELRFFGVNPCLRRAKRVRGTKKPRCWLQ